jgi:UDP-2,3-diacylglucosamine pyrophosphatase LpxH/glycosyltransferase involved in cell wall biosynthesis
MRIALVTDTFPPDVNGVAMTLEQLALGLMRRGHEIALLTTRPAGSEDPEGLAREVIASVPLPGYPELRFGVPAPNQLAGFVARWRPDAFYVATESALGYSALRAAKKAGIPAYSGFHTKYHSYMGDYNLPILEQAAVGYLKRLHSSARATFVPSEDTKVELGELGFQNLHVLGRGIDTALFRPEARDHGLRSSWGGDESTPVAIYVGRLAAEKNLPLLAETFARLRLERPELRCVLVGDGPKMGWLREAYPHFEYAGVRRGEDLARHYASADVFVFPSLSETYGNVVMEAMASGLVAVAFDYAAAKLHVRHAANGFLAARGDEEAFFGAARAALGRWNDWSLRRRAVETAAAQSWDVIVEHFEAILLEDVEVRPLNWAGGADDVPGLVIQPGKVKGKLHFRSVFLSDIHLGAPDSKVNQVIHFLRNVRCDKLVLNGDIIDGWSLRRGGKWTKSHTYFVRLVLKMMERQGTKVLYLRGNHDDILTRFLPIALGGLEIVGEHIHEGLEGKYLVVHGDGFDAVTTNYRWVAVLGGIGYEWLLKLNRAWNGLRHLQGKPSYSLSKAIKARVKSAVSFVGRYEDQLQRHAHRKGCMGIICGHVHTAANKKIGDIHYLNSGDWVESLTAVVEHEDGKFEVITYHEFCRRTNRNPKGRHVESKEDFALVAANPLEEVMGRESVAGL